MGLFTDAAGAGDRYAAFGYADMNATWEQGEPSEAGLQRLVLGAQWQPEAHTRLKAEVELEHLVSSPSESTEVGIEQAYVERDTGMASQLRAGILVMPIGLLNGHDDPDDYYSVTRNHVETEIIPTTWHQGGIGWQLRTGHGWRLDLGLTSGLDMAKWRASAAEGEELSPLGAMKPERELGPAAGVSGYVAAQYHGNGPLQFGASLFLGGARAARAGLPDGRVSLGEVHARWRRGPWELAALYARGHITDTAALNLTLPVGTSLMPADFHGGYVESAWRGLQLRGRELTPFIRYERFNAAAGYEPLSPTLTPAGQPDLQALTGGVQYAVGTHVLLKAEYVRFLDGAAGSGPELGLAVMF